MHWEILDVARRKILPKLGFIKSGGFYLAGGTALALHVGHRKSVDFDFYSTTQFDENRLEQELVTRLAGFKITQRNPGTIIGHTGTIDFSFFHYSYPLLVPPSEENTLSIAGIPDIGAMKLIAVSQRGLRRDFLDLYTIAQQAGLHTIFEWAQKKYPQFDPYVALKSLVYFDDAQGDTSGRGMDLTRPISWSKLKTFFVNEVKSLSKQWL